MRTLQGRGGLWRGHTRLGDCSYNLGELSHNTDEWQGVVTFMRTDWTPNVGKGYTLELEDGRKLACDFKALKDPPAIGRTHSYEVWCRL
jgi:hypothetical protein